MAVLIDPRGIAVCVDSEKAEKLIAAGYKPAVVAVAPKKSTKKPKKAQA